MTALQNALPFAKAGWKLFPAIWNNGSHKGCIKWGEGSSADPAQIEQWAAQFPNAYFCVHLKASGLTVLDVDNKKGKEGGKVLQTLLNAHNSMPPTLESATPSGGQHFFFKGLCAFTVDKLGIGLDTPVMVPLPGSRATGKGDYTLIKRGPLADIPGWIIDAAGKPSERKDNYDIPLTDLDQQHNIDRAISWLESYAPISEEGAAGDHTAYTVAAKMRDFAISESTAVDLLLEHWYPRCEPNNKPEFIEKKVRNAYGYANDRAGNATPEALFTEIKSTATIRCAADASINSLEPRKWVLGHRYLIGYTTLTIAPGGTGKSLLTILEGLSVASGKQLTHDVVKRPGAVWTYNTEDPFDELDRRVIAAAKHHNLTKQDLTNFYYSSAYENPLTLVAYDDRGRPVKNEPAINQLILDLKARNVVLFIVDPFVECHAVSENDNGAINMVMRVFRHISDAAQCAVSIVHHVSKGKSEHGNMDKARGAGSMAAAARIAHTFYNMGEKESKEYGIPQHRAAWYTRIDDAKGNMSPPGADFEWYEKKSVSLWVDNDETVGTLERVKLDAVIQESREEEVMLGAINLVDEEGPLTLRYIAGILAKMKITDKAASTVLRDLHRIFAQPIKSALCIYRITEQFNDKNVKTRYLTKEEEAPK